MHGIRWLGLRPCAELGQCVGELIDHPIALSIRFADWPTR